MSQYSIGRDYLAARIATVTDAGTVHTHERLLVQPQKFQEAFAGTFSGQEQIRGWIITLAGIEGDSLEFRKTDRVYTYTIYGIMGVQDSADSEEVFYDLLEDVMDALDTSAPVLGMSGEVVDSRGPASARNLGYRQFGSPFCHYGEITFAVSVSQA